MEDSAGNITADDVEAALAEIFGTPSATTRRVLELATTAEIDAGTDAVRAIVSDQLKASAMLGWDNGSFTVTFPDTVFTTVQTHTWYYVRTGQVVVAFYTAELSGTSNANYFLSDVSIPAAIRPNATQKTTIEIKDNGTKEVGFIGITATGQVQVTRVTGSAFTSSGTKALAAAKFTITWFLGDQTAF